MLAPEKKDVIGVMVSPATYDQAISLIVQAAQRRRRFTVSALAVHGVMTGVLSREHRYRLNHLDLVVPDGQPVRWVLNFLHKAALPDRCYGPELTGRLCARAAQQGLPIFLYGTTPAILDDFQAALRKKYPGIRVAGAEPSRFRRLDPNEKASLIARVRDSGAAILFVGLGCPRQETFAYELGDQLSMPVVAVGAAFAFIAGHVPQAPAWMQKRGLEWLYRLGSEPRRLWRRYLYLNPSYLFLVGLQTVGIRVPRQAARMPLREELFG
jgi:exopolysaccharide biosynthesis WecB/TagA/CpsF family protein